MGMSCCISHDASVELLRRKCFIVLCLLLLMPSLAALLFPMPLDCKSCVCASNIISCSKTNLTQIPTELPPFTAVLDLSFNSIGRLKADWTPNRLGRLHTLQLSHNGLHFLSTEAFVYVTRLRLLDLSCNNLKQLDEFIFEPLEHLEVLLLYNNKITQIDRSAFAGLMSLQKLYMSNNQVSRFPLELVKERSRLETLKLLDMSGNKIKNLPLNDLQELPAWIKNGLYFHRNPVPCSCELYDLVARWYTMELSSAKDYKDEHTCVLPGSAKEKMAVMDLNKVYLNCSEVMVMNRESFLEQFLVLDCDTRQRNVIKSWVLPGNVPLSPAHKTALMLDDGSLQIGPLTADDSGVYTCYASGESFNETLYITVLVFNGTMSGGLENLKTAYTTLVGCLITVVFVLIYLYLTPCHCPCCPGQDLEKTDPRDSLHSSTVSIANRAQDNTPSPMGGHTFSYKHVGFMEEQLKQNGRLNPIGEEDEEWQGEATDRHKSDIGSGCSGHLYSPMVV
ncbi:amphoterin-induced protein 1-like [Boleophthalmus pectinirostris]|uniref:amphoterin-induced protein 1-like n=1 Tax=Boleophthalmus pectinirostris TaxID=150288 RepID=UPI000A1C5A14|nr:amphoterin-induced protein 1-like [Boleophthalmus pectinirostris]